MCGLVGFYNPVGFQDFNTNDILKKMSSKIIHRGPDDFGFWHNVESGIALSHRRLSILDLSLSGHQPMISHSGRYVIVYNGEIYNHIDLRQEIDSKVSVRWRGTSDTESLLEAIELWGLEQALIKSVGMFAFALWDRKEHSLSLARDRMGEKPLYYGWQKGNLLFGSELKALRAHPSFANEIEWNVLPLYLSHGYIPSPWSVWSGIRKLIPGSVVEFDSSLVGEYPEPKPYWSLSDVVNKGKLKPFSGSEKDAEDRLHHLLSVSVGRQRFADVPLGAFLSGGIDSSTVVALMQANSTNPVKTFTIGFSETVYNEAKHANAIATHLGTDHTEHYVTPSEARDVIPYLPDMYDEPFGDSSAIPTYLVSRLAREKVTVSLSGDGGDELFSGYDRYHRMASAWQSCQRVPQGLRKVVSGFLRSPIPKLYDSMFMNLKRSHLSRFGHPIAPRALHFANLMMCENKPQLYRTMTSQWHTPPVRFAGSQLLSFSKCEEELLSLVPEPEQWAMAFDSLTYLPDDILAKVDRASMSVSLESRIPLLDHHIMELAWSLPFSMKVKEGKSKWILREVLGRYVPKGLTERPKMGFGVPIDRWLRGPLRDWATDLLSENSLLQGGLNPIPILKRWNEHLSGHYNWKDSIWLILMWQSWIQRHQ